MYICFQVFMNFISYSLKNNFLKDTGTISLLTAKEISTRDNSKYNIECTYSVKFQENPQ